MIDLNNKKTSYAFFGDGTLGVSAAISEQAGAKYPVQVWFSDQTDEPSPIGTTVDDYRKVSEVDNTMMALMFKTPDSIDVVIRALQEAKSFYEDLDGNRKRIINRHKELQNEKGLTTK